MSDSDAKGPPSAGRPSISKLIENLDCIDTVDVMLLEGTPASDVARFIQQDQGELTEVNEKTLATALLARRLQRQEVTKWFGAKQTSGGDEMPKAGSYRRAAITRRTLVDSLYNRTKGGIREMLELEALYLALVDRIDRMMELESELGAFSEDTGKEIQIAAKILVARYKIAKDLGLTEGTEGFRQSMDFKTYSERTVQILSNPESRHRVISLVERIAAHARGPSVRTVPEPKSVIALPMPRASGDDDDQGNK
jgi:hypothetical protein